MIGKLRLTILVTVICVIPSIICKHDDNVTVINDNDFPVNNESLSLNTSINTTKEKDGDVAYCSTPPWEDMQTRYRGAHGELSLVVCIVGSLLNIINVVVLTRRSMQTPTNAILTGLAVTDLLVMAEYIPYTVHQYIWKARPMAIKYSWSWAVFVLFHAHFAQVFHTISIWLTVTLAVWRYIAIAMPTRSVTWCSMARTHTAIAVAFVCSLLCNIPNYLNFTVQQKEFKGETLYLVHFSALALALDGLLQSINFWVYAVAFKLLPCVALTIFSMALIQELLRAARRRAVLMKRNTTGRGSEAEHQADRVTLMLLAILILFLLSEFPQGVLALLAMIPDSGFFPCYQKLGEMMDMLVLFNSAINFMLYYAMSQQFRSAFCQLCQPLTSSLALPMLMRRWTEVPTRDTVNTNNTTV